MKAKLTTQLSPTRSPPHPAPTRSKPSIWPAVLIATLLTGASQAQPAGDGAGYRNEKFGFSLRVPSEVFQPTPARDAEAGALWTSADGQVRLVAGAQSNDSSESMAGYRKFLMEKTYDQATFDYTPSRDNWFVLSGIKDGQMFYERVTFACNGRYIYGWQMTYPATERRRYDRIVEAIHRTFRVGQGVDGSCK